MSSPIVGDALASLFTPPPPGPAAQVQHRTGIILAWDPVTLSNTVMIDGQEYTDLPVKNSAEIRVLAAGARVAIFCARYSDGSSSWAIDGRIIRPNTDEATQVIDILDNGNVISDFVAATEDIDVAGGWIDLDTYGPEVTVTVGPSGRILLMLAAVMNLGNIAATGLYGYELSGANVQAPTAGAKGTINFGYLQQSANDALESSEATIAELDGLTPGVTTITAKYRATTVTAPSHPVFFRNRAMVVITL